MISKFTVRPDFDLHQGWTNFAEEVNSRCGKRCLGQLENPRTKWRFYLIGKSSINEGILWYLIAIPAHIWDWNPTMSLFLCEFGNSYYFRAKGPAPQKHVQDAISAGCRRSFEMALPACGWVRWPHPTMVLPTPCLKPPQPLMGRSLIRFFPGELYQKEPGWFSNV